MAELKTQKTKVNPKTFLSGIKDEKKRTDALALLSIFTEATKLKPAMWGPSIVGYGSYHYKSERSRQEGHWPLTGFSPRSQNLTIYLMSGAKNYEDLLKKLGKHSISGGSCIYIKRLSDIHLPTLKAIVKKSVAEMKKKYPDWKS